MKFFSFVPLVVYGLVVGSMIELATAKTSNSIDVARNSNNDNDKYNSDVTVRGGSAVKTPPRSMEDLEKKGRSMVHRRSRELGQKMTTAQNKITRNANQVAKKVTAAVTAESETNQKPSIVPSLWEHKEALMGIVVLTLLERGINKIFVGQSIKFPAQLAGCIGLFVTLILADMIRPGLGESMYNSLLPGSNLLAKWFPVLFVPGLVMLPLAPSIGNGVEVAKFISVAVLGLVYSMLTTAYTVLFLRSFQGSSSSSTKTSITTTARAVTKRIPKTWKPRQAATASPKLPAAAPKAYRDETMTLLFRMTIVSGIVSILATNAGNEFAQPVRTLFFFCTTFSSFVWGARLPSSVTKIVHPLILSAMITLGVIQGTSMATSEAFVTVLKSYKVGTYDLATCGAADIMMFLLGPSVVSFALSMYNRRLLLKDNLVIVLLSMLVSSVGGLFGTAGFVRLIALGGKEGGGMIRLSTLARNVTTALAIACTNVLQGDVSLAVLIVVMTGVLGATYGRTMLDALGIQDPITRGLAVGGAAQGLGVTSMMTEPDAFPFAAMSMILTAISATVLVSIPPIQQALVTLCQGNL